MQVLCITPCLLLASRHGFYQCFCETHCPDGSNPEPSVQSGLVQCTGIICMWFFRQTQFRKNVQLNLMSQAGLHAVLAFECTLFLRNTLSACTVHCFHWLQITNQSVVHVETLSLCENMLLCCLSLCPQCILMLLFSKGQNNRDTNLMQYCHHLLDYLYYVVLDKFACEDDEYCRFFFFLWQNCCDTSFHK